MPPITMNRRSFCASALLVGAASLGGGCGGPPRKRPNVVFIVIDSARADHTSAWGYARDTTPVMREFLKQATQFARTYAPAPWTLPSHAAMFTGRYPARNGVHEFLVEKANEAPQVLEPQLDSSYDTLAEVLGQEGYDTAAFVANSAYLDPRFNLTQGYDDYDSKHCVGSELAAKAISWMKGRGGKPFFLFMNFIDGHYPYNTTPVPGLIQGEVSQDPALVKRLCELILPGEGATDPVMQQQVLDQYHTGMANADAGVGLVFDALRQMGVYEETLVVYTSDHGEFMGEHRLITHSKDLYNPVTWVPLSIKRPGQTQPNREEGVVSLVDIAGRILEEVAGDAGERRFPSFFENNSRHFPVFTECYYSRNWDLRNPKWRKRFLRVRTAMYSGDLKYIRSSDGDNALFNLTADPGESQNLLEAQPEVAGKLRAQLDAQMPPTLPRANSTTAQPTMNEGQKRQMESLGYL